MFNDKKVAVVIPCYNEETQISRVIKTMPEFVDKIIIVDDLSDDNTVVVVENLAKINSRIELIKH
ncbi:uncharacterized protein METZ01_LOCUS457709, partial [marine metagenome]